MSFDCESEEEKKLEGNIDLLPVDDPGLAKHVDTTDQDQGTNSPSSVATLFPTTTVHGSTDLFAVYSNLLSQAETYCEWVEVEEELARQVQGKPHALSLFRSVYRIGVQLAIVLKALAYLVNDNQVEESLTIIAAYFCVPVVTETTKLACVRLLVVLKSPLDAGWQVEEPFLRDTLAFIMQTNDWEFLEHSENDLLYRLRELVSSVRRIECQGSGRADECGHEHEPVTNSASLSTSSHQAGDLNLPQSGSKTAPRDCYRPSPTPPAASPRSQDHLNRSPSKNRSRQNLRELEDRFKDHLEGSPQLGSLAFGRDTASEPLSDNMSAPQDDEELSHPEFPISGRFDALSLGSFSLMKRVTTAVAIIVPTSAAIALEDAMAPRSAASMTSDTSIDNVWNMQLSKLSEYTKS